MVDRSIDVLAQRLCSVSPAVYERECVKGIYEVADLDVWSIWVNTRRVARASISNRDLVNRLQLG
jgi:hypothetical protein